MDDRVKALEKALNAALVTLRDLDNGWLERDLHEPLEVTIARAAELLGRADDEEMRPYVEAVRKRGKQ